MRIEYNNFNMRLLDEAADRLAKAERSGARNGMMLFTPTGYGIWYKDFNDARKALKKITVPGCSYLVWRDGTGYACVADSVEISE
jgi:hypothetical protein